MANGVTDAESEGHILTLACVMPRSYTLPLFVALSVFTQARNNVNRLGDFLVILRFTASRIFFSSLLFSFFPLLDGISGYIVFFQVLKLENIRLER